MSIKDINIIDSLVVITILLIVFLSLTFYFIPKSASRPAYQIVVNDADGLIIGSSVIFGGKDVGHVTRLRFEENQVIVNFVIENPDFPKIPDGSEITVKSTGLAGSKALEIYYPPNTHKKGITVKDCFRQVDSNNLQVLMAKQIINSADAITSTVSDKQLLDIKNFAKHETITTNIEAVLNQIVSQMDKAQKNLDKKTLKNINKKLEFNDNAND